MRSRRSSGHRPPDVRAPRPPTLATSPQQRRRGGRGRALEILAGCAALGTESPRGASHAPPIRRARVPMSTSSMRVLQICEVCRAQLDTSGLAAGARVRCVCGASLVVRMPAARVPRALRCSSCGGNLKDGARACAYCAAEITLDELRLDSVCPDCGARMSSDARHCMECGIAVAPQSCIALPESARCPRCASGLRQRRVGTHAFVECRSCAGLWLEAGLLDELCARSERDAGVVSGLGLPTEPERAVDASPVRYLPCVRCTQPMHRRNFGGSSGLIVDVCKDHGVWLDHGELERALAFARQGGLVRARAVESERLKAEAARGSARSGLPLERERDELSIGLEGGWLGQLARAAWRACVRTSAERRAS